MRNAIVNLHSSVRTILLLLSVMVISFACSDDTDKSLKNAGILSLSLASDTTFGKSTVTKSAADEFIDFLNPDYYSIEILQGEEIVLSYPYFREMPEEVELPEGSYTMRAYKGENKGAAFSNPYFEGKVNFSIHSGMRTPITDTCYLANTRVYINYTDDFLEAYPTHQVTLSTEYMEEGDSLYVGQDETRGAYFRSDNTGTDLEIVLGLVKLEDSVMNYYKPSPIPIKPRQNVNLLFKTDGEAINGIGLEVTLNNSLDGEETLNMTIPEYAWNDVKEPDLSPWFNGETDNPYLLENITYFTLQQKISSYYLDYTVPASVGKCIVSIETKKEGSRLSLKEFDLATTAGAASAKELGILITNQQATETANLPSNQTYTLATETKNGRIHLTNALAQLNPSKDEMEYIYTIYIIDALAVNPNSTDTVVFTVKPDIVETSKLELTGITSGSSTSINAFETLSENITVAFNTNAGIQTAILQIDREGHSPVSYHINIDNLPAGITYANGLLTFDKAFITALELEPLTEEIYTFTISATDLMGETFENSGLNFMFKIQPVFEIEVPTIHTWGWKARVNVKMSGLSTANENDLKVYMSSNQYSHFWEEEKKYAWLTGLENDTEYTVSVEYKGTPKNIHFRTEANAPVLYGDMNTWYLAGTRCRYNRSWIGTYSGTIYIPNPSVYASSNTGWSTNNNTTAGSQYDVSDSNGNEVIPTNCFPTVLYEEHTGNGLAAVIRSIDATSGNGKARGELAYEKEISSRPSSLSFEYMYQPVNNEYFIASVNIIADDEEVIGYGSISQNEIINNSNDYQSTTIKINYTSEEKKAGKIKLLFASASDPENFSTSITANITGPTAASSSSTVTSISGTTNYMNVRYGSTLKIDNVVLNYTGE